MASDDEELEVFLGKISNKEQKSRKISRRTVLYIPGFRNKYLDVDNFDSISDEHILSEDEMESEDSMFPLNPDNVNEDSGVDCSRDSRCPDSSHDFRFPDSSHDFKCQNLSRDSRCADSTMDSLSTTIDLNIAHIQDSTFDLEADMPSAISDIEESTTDPCSMLNQGLLDFGSKLSISGDFESSTMSRKNASDRESKSGKHILGKSLDVSGNLEDSKSTSSINPTMAETKSLDNRKLKRKIAVTKKSSKSKLSEKSTFSLDDTDENKENCAIDLSARAISENNQNVQNEIVPAIRKVAVKKSQYFNDENLKLSSTPVINKFDTARLRNKHLQTDLQVLSSPIFISPKTKCSRMEANITVRSDMYPDRMPTPKPMVTRNLNKSSAFSTYKSPSASKSKIPLIDSRENEIVKLYSPRGNKKYFSPLSESTPKVFYSDKKNSERKYFSPLTNSPKESNVQGNLEQTDVYVDVKGKMMPPLTSVSNENIASQDVSSLPGALHPRENGDDTNNIQPSQESESNHTPSKSKLCSFCLKRETDVQGNSTEKATLACTCLESESVCHRLAQLCMDNCNTMKDSTETSAGASLLSIKKAQLEKLRIEKREIEEKIRAAETSDSDMQTPTSKSVMFRETDSESSDEASSTLSSPHAILGRNCKPGRSPKNKDSPAISRVVEERALASFEWNQCAGDTYSRGSPHPILGRGHRPRQKRCRPKERDDISKIFAKIEEQEMKDTAVDTLTKIHTLCNAQRVVEFANVSQLPMVIKHFPPPKEASRIQWSEDLVESQDALHTPASTPPKTQPILTKRSDGHVFPYNGDAPSPIVITKMRKTNTLGRQCQKPAQHTVM